jgi:superfamily I DNA/RNA helicase
LWRLQKAADEAVEAKLKDGGKNGLPLFHAQVELARTQIKFNMIIPSAESKPNLFSNGVETLQSHAEALAWAQMEDRRENTDKIIRAIEDLGDRFRPVSIHNPDSCFNVFANLIQ